VLRHRALPGAGHPDQDDVARLPGDGLGNRIRQLRRKRAAQEQFRRADPLRRQHGKPVARRDPQVVGLEEQGRAVRVINQVQYQPDIGERRKVHRGGAVSGVHAHGRRVDEEDRVFMAVQVAVMVHSRPGDDDGADALIHEYGAHRAGGPAAAQHDGFLAREGGGFLSQQVGKSPVVGVVPQKTAVFETDHRVDAADGFRARREPAAQGDHVHLIGDRHVEAVEVGIAHEAFHGPARHGVQRVLVVPDQAVYRGGKAVVQLLPDQAEAGHQTTSE